MKPFKQPETKDTQTENIYKSKKHMYSMVRDTFDRLNAAQKKYYTDMKEFIDKYESGEITHWHQFFKHPGSKSWGK